MRGFHQRHDAAEFHEFQMRETRPPKPQIRSTSSAETMLSSSIIGTRTSRRQGGRSASQSPAANGLFDIGEIEQCERIEIVERRFLATIARLRPPQS